MRTPLVPYPHTPQRLLVKPESLQPTGSFKIRGAYAAISALPETRREQRCDRPLQRQSRPGRRVRGGGGGLPGRRGRPADRRGDQDRVRSLVWRAVVLVEPSLAARVSATEELADRYGYAMIPPFDDAGVIAGQGTIGLEIAADCDDVDVVLVPVSGGGLISGIAAAIHAVSPGALVVGVEPELAADARDSLREGRRIAWRASLTARTLADALRVEQVGELPFAHLRAYVHDIVTVTEDEIRGAVRRIADELRLIAEPGGAVAVAAYLYRRAELPSAHSYVAVLSGGNIAPALRAELLGG